MFYNPFSSIPDYPFTLSSIQLIPGYLSGVSHIQHETAECQLSVVTSVRSKKGKLGSHLPVQGVKQSSTICSLSLCNHDTARLGQTMIDSVRVMEGLLHLPFFRAHDIQ